MTAPLALPRTAHLRQPAEFTALQRDGKRLSTALFQTRYRLTERGTARLGMAVSRRVSKSAVVRNRIRRTIRESFRLQRGRLPESDILLIARHEAAASTRSALRSDLQTIWQRLAALKPQGATRTIPPGL